MRAAVLTLLALATTLTAADGAAAALFRMDVASLRPQAQPQNVSGPVFAGEDVVWTEEAAPRLTHRIRALDPSGTARDVGVLPAPTGGPYPFDARGVTLAGSSTRVLAGTLDLVWGDRLTELYRATVWSAGSGGPVEQLRARESTDQQPSGYAVRATEGAFAIGDDVFAEEAPSTPAASFTAARFVDLAGDLALVADADGLRVVRWRDSSELYRPRVAGIHTVDLQPDGKLAFVLVRDGVRTAGWASPEEPWPHLLPVEQSAELDVAIAGDRIAVRTTDDVAVFTLDGGLVALVDAPDVLGAPAFDGRRVAWAARRCAVTFVATWSPGEAVPRLPSAGCRPPGPSPHLFRLARRAGTLTVGLRCPADAANGCDGTAEAEVWAVGPRGRRRGPRRKATGWVGALLPGRSATATLRLSAGAQSIVRAFRDLRVRVRVHDTHGGGFEQRTYRLPSPPL